MGIQKNIRLKGSWGNAVFYELNGKGIIRSKPAQVKQTASTKLMAGLFGRATQLGKFIRQSWKAHLPLEPQRALQYRLESTLRQCLKEGVWSHLLGFELDPGTPSSKYGKLELQARMNNSNLSISLPGFNPMLTIKAMPRHTEQLDVCLVIAQVSYGQPALLFNKSLTCSIPINEALWEGKSRQLELPPVTDSLILIMVQLQPKKKGFTINQYSACITCLLE